MIDIQEHLVYQTQNASILQKDDKDCYELQFFRQKLEIRPCELLAFRRKINSIDIVTLLESDGSDVEVIHLPSCNRIFVFTIQEILELKELIHGTFAMLELNSLIHRQLNRLAV